MCNNLKINACSGGIYKSYKESFFINFSLNSKVADVLFKRDFNHYDYKTVEEKYGNLIILQMILCGDNYVIAEVIDKDIFDDYFSIGKERGAEECYE